MLTLSLPSAGICEWSGPWGECCTPASRFAPEHASPRRGQLGGASSHRILAAGCYPAFFPPWSGRLAGCQGCGAPPRMQHGARRLSAAAGPPSPETTRPSVQHSAPLAAAGSEVEHCIPGLRISMRHVGG